MLRRCIVVVATGLVLLTSAGVTAEELALTAQVRVLFQEALDFADQGEWEQAADRFGRAYALRPAPVIGYNLASALARLGQVVEAQEILNRLQRDAETNDDIRQRCATLQEALSPRLASLTIRLNGPADEVVVELDGRELTPALLEVALQVNPGDHQVRALRGDEELQMEQVRLGDGERRSVVLDLPALPERLERPEPVGVGQQNQAAARPWHRSWWFWTIVGVAAAGAVATAVAVPLANNEPTPVEGSWGTITVP